MRLGITPRCEIGFLRRLLSMSSSPAYMYAEFRAKSSTSTSTANRTNMSENSANEEPVEPMAEVEEKKGVRKSPKSAVVIIPPDHLSGQIQAIREKHDKGFIRWMPHINMLWPFLEDVNDGLVFQEAKDRLTTALADVKPFTVSFTRDSFGYFEHKKYCTLWLKPLNLAEVEAAKLCQAAEQQNASDASSAMKETTEEMDYTQEQMQTTEGNQENGDQDGATGFADVKPKSKRRKKGKKQQPKRPDPHRPHIPFQSDVIALQKQLEKAIPECDDLGTGFEGFKPHLSLGQFKANTVEDDLKTFQSDWDEFSFEVNEVYMISRKDYHDPFHVQYGIRLGGVKD